MESPRRKVSAVSEELMPEDVSRDTSPHTASKQARPATQWVAVLLRSGIRRAFVVTLIRRKDAGPEHDVALSVEDGRAQRALSITRKSFHPGFDMALTA
jgi:hypothetical protein